MTCECGLVVKVGTGGEANLMSHRNSSNHWNAMQKLFPDSTYSFFDVFLLRTPTLSYPIHQKAHCQTVEPTAGQDKHP